MIFSINLLGDQFSQKEISEIKVTYSNCNGGNEAAHAYICVFGVILNLNLHVSEVNHICLQQQHYTNSRCV